MKKILAFDLGSSSGRAIEGKYADGKLQYKESHRFKNVPIWHNGHLCWDFEKIMKEIYLGIEKAGEIDSIGIDAWGADFGVLDQNGDLLSLPVHYRDLRTEGMIKEAQERITGKRLFQLSGNQTYATNTLYQILALRKTEPEIWNQTRKLLHIPDLVSYLLCRNAVCERTIASTTQMLDPDSGMWSQEILDEFQIPRQIFGTMIDTGTIIGEYKGVKVIAVAGHDTQSAGAAMTEDVGTTAFLNIGTWSLLGIENEKAILSDEGYKLGISNEQGPYGGIHCIMNITGMWLLQECRRTWEEEGILYSYDELEKLAEQAESFGIFLDLNMADFAQPGNMPEKIRTFCRRTGQRIPETVGEIVRCIYESLASTYSKELKKLEQGSGRRIEKLQILGGGARSEMLCQMTADYCGRPVTAGPVEATALGNLIIQLKALGEIADASDARRILQNGESFRYYVPQRKQRE